MVAGSDQVALEAALKALLPRAKLTEQTLPGCPELRLLLLDDSLKYMRLDGEVAARIVHNPLYWVFCWASGQVLAAHLLKNRERVAGRRVLDFGAGSGAVAVAAALAGAAEVIACDVDPLARTASRCNAALNDVEVGDCADLREVSGDLDLIVVADVLYDRANLVWPERLRQRAPHVLLADSRIRDFDHPAYRLIAVQESTTIPDLDESPELRRVTLYESLCRSPRCEQTSRKAGAR